MHQAIPKLIVSNKKEEAIITWRRVWEGNNAMQ